MQCAEDFSDDMPRYSAEDQVMDEIAYQEMYDAQHDQRPEEERAAEARIDARHAELAARIYGGAVADARADGLAARKALGGESFEQTARRAQAALSAMWPDNELVHARIGNMRGAA